MLKILTLTSVLFTQPAIALVIQLNDLGGAGANTLAGIGFRQAANVYETIFTDPITINLDIGFENLGSGILGATTSNSINTSFSQIKSALVNDMQSIDDNIATQYLPANSVNFISNDSSGQVIFDNNNTTNNQSLSVNTANLKALGLLNSNSTDATIKFSNQYSYDFDSSDGISSGLFDFVGIAMHEIGHALGFVSGVDTIDYYTGSGPGAGFVSSFDSFSLLTTLDLFRYSNDSLNYGEGVRDFSARNIESFFSIDGGQTPLAPFAAGRYNGDARQASHWKDNLNLGLFDPTTTAGELGLLSVHDLLALDVIGYDLQLPTIPVPNISTLWLLLSGLLFLAKIPLQQKRETL